MKTIILKVLTLGFFVAMVILGHRDFARNTLAARPPPPIVSSVTPGSGPTTGGTAVVITGSGFSRGETVYFGASLASDTVVGATETDAISPMGTGTVDITVTVMYGPDSFTSPTNQSDQFTYIVPALAGGGQLAADAGVSESVDNAHPVQRSAIHITLTASNLGPSTAKNVSVQDNLPSGLTFVSVNAATGTFTSSTGVWSIGNLPVNVTTTLVLAVMVSGTAGQSITNNAVISETVGGGTYDQNGSNNLASQILRISTGVATTVTALAPTVSIAAVAADIRLRSSRQRLLRPQA